MDFFDFLWRYLRVNFLMLAAVAVAAAVASLFEITSSLGLGLLLMGAGCLVAWNEIDRSRDRSRMSYEERYGDGWFSRSIDRIRTTITRAGRQPPSPR
jgi:hypothetical protein